MNKQILNIDEFLKEDSIENLNDILTQAFVDYIQLNIVSVIKYNKNVTGSRSLMLKTKLVIENRFPLAEIYSELVNLCVRNGLNGIIVVSLSVTPEVIDAASAQKSRGIIARIVPQN